MNDISYMIEHIAADIVAMLVEKRNMEIEEAIDVLYTSDTYSKLRDARTGLYFQSSKYVYSILEQEMLTGVMG